MSAWVVWLLVGLGFGAVAARRPVAALLVTAQTVLVGVGALAMAPGRSGEFAVAAGLLLLKALVVGAIVVVGMRRLSEARPHAEETGFLVRVGGAVAFALVMAALIPSYGLESRAAENAAAALLATGLALALVRRATVFAVLAFLVAENGIAVAAVSVSGGVPLVIELGVAFDLVLLIAVAAVFQRRILATFGTTDSDVLRGIRG
jgi:hydrogenase-4 component E